MLLDEVLARLENLSIEEIEPQDNRIEVEDLINISPCLHTENHLTYSIFLGLRKDLSDEEVSAYKSLIDVLRAREKREMEKRYSHFEPANYN